MNEINVKGPTPDWSGSEWNTFRDWLKSMLRVGPATVTFTKKDGTERVMKCTLVPDQLPAVEIKEDKAPRKQKTEDVLAVYDVEANGWRSFTIRAVKRVEFTL
jgi:hypothetical protein